MTKIFISYSREDEKFAQKLFNNLKQDKMDPWLDDQKIITGDKWEEKIDKEINTTHCFLPILSKASINNNRYFQTEVDIAIQVSESRDNNFIMPVRNEECDPGHTKLKDYNILDLFPSFEHQYKKLLKHIKEHNRKFDFKKITDISLKTVDFLSKFATISYVASQFMSDDVQPPKYNMDFASYQFPKEGGKVQLLGPDVADQLRTIRLYARENNYRYTAFFIDQKGHVIGHTANNKKLKYKAIQLDIPENTSMVFIALGYGDDLEYAKESFGKVPITHDQLLWVVYGEKKTAIPDEKKDFLKIFKSIIFDADKIINVEERYRYLEKKRQTIMQAFDALHQVKDWGNIGMMLNIMMTETKDSPVALFSERQSHELCKELEENENNIKRCFIEFNFLRAKELSNNAINEQPGLKYTDRHRFIESAIRLIWDQCDKDNKWLHNDIISDEIAYQLIAKCYLYRSKLALTKGKSIPEKKLEALSKAMEWAKDDVNEINKKNKINDLIVYILLEQYTWDKHFSKKELENGLKNYFCQYKKKVLDLSNIIQFAVIDKLINILTDKKERLGDEFSDSDEQLLKQLTEYDEQILSLPKTHKLTPFFGKGCFLKEAEDISFYQLVSANRLGRVDDISKFLNAAISKLSKHFQTHIIWEKTISILNQVAEKKIFEGKWEDSAISAWEKCIEVENLIKLPIQLRWYWSSYNLLYDLAFQAALNKKQYMLAARIADAVKSRPTIKIQNVEQTLKINDYFKQFIETDTLSFTEAYMVRFENLKQSSSAKIKLTLKIEDIPEDWTAIHFYIQKDIDNEAFALIISSETKKCIPVKLDISKLWKTFNKWQADKRAFKAPPANTLKQMCIDAGEMLKPVLDQITTQKIIFIPHGFLHLVPLHAAIIDQEDTYLLSKKLCVYLPSWSIISGKIKPVENINDYFFSNWKNEEELNKLEWKNEEIGKDTPDGVINLLKTNFPLTPKNPQNTLKAPNLLVFFCHGKGDYMNPYQSKFILNKGNLTHNAIVAGKFLLNGTKVLLTACETDLVSSDLGLVDEHLSLSNAFLTQNASEVLGAIYECRPDDAKKIIKYIKANPKKTLYESLQDIQKQWVDEKKSITDIAVFRVMALPKTGENKIA
ncbi:TIR protein [Candidatus Magnetomorum sp. HK-1]|nr:TIR protein [Candidatus Magnetomorum sp. HK-1]